MFPLTPEGDRTAAVSEHGWVGVCGGGVEGSGYEWIEFTRLQTGCFQVKAIGKSRKALSAETFCGRLRWSWTSSMLHQS